MNPKSEKGGWRHAPQSGRSLYENSVRLYRRIVAKYSVSKEGRTCPIKNFVTIANFEYGLCSNNNGPRMVPQFKFSR